MADDSTKPAYVHFFGVMGATAAMVFSGECDVNLTEMCPCCSSGGHNDWGFLSFSLL